MKTALSLVFGALLVAGVAAAQNHDNMKERKASDEINIDTDLRVGTIVVPPGDYRIVCDRKEITFTRMLDGKRFKVPCTGKELDKKVTDTKIITRADKNGGRYLYMLLLHGSNVEHVFD